MINKVVWAWPAPIAGGQEKVNRLQAWLGDKPVELDMAYGDSPGDAQMLAHTRQPWLRGRDAALPALEVR